MKISVIIPIFNAEEYLRSCVESVCNQTYRDLEIILVDDGSTDTSGAICDQLAQEDSRIIVIHQANCGVSAARNAGLKQITGELVSFIDADDMLDGDMYEFLTKLIEHYDADIAHCGYRRTEGNQVTLINDTKQTYEQNRLDALKCLIGGRLFVGSLWNKLMRRSLLSSLCFDERLKINEDVLFVYQAFCRANKTVFADYPKYNYIVRPESSVCIRTQSLKKYLDVASVTKRIYLDCVNTPLQLVAAERYIRTLCGLYQIYICERKETDILRKDIHAAYCENRQIGWRMKIRVFLICHAPFLYQPVVSLYSKVRKPNWDV